MARTTGVESSPKNLNVATGVDKNHTGFAMMNGRLWATAWQDTYVWALKIDDLASAPLPYWQSASLGRNATTRTQTHRTGDAHVRVGGGDRVFKLKKADGTLAVDSDGVAGPAPGPPDDWGADRVIRGNILGTPTILGNEAKTIAGNGSASARGAKMIFGTDQGCCYVLSYIRDSVDTADANGDSQKANSLPGPPEYDIMDGRPYPGFPYRVPGVKVTRAFVATHSTGRNLIVFLFDNGWMYAFIEPF